MRSSFSGHDVTSGWLTMVRRFDIDIAIVFVVLACGSAVRQGDGVAGVRTWNPDPAG